MLDIQNHAIFIADSHYPHHGEAFLHLLQAIEQNKIITNQLFLMGDNFDLLFGYNTYIQSFSKKAIRLIQRLSKRIDIYYLEGNHDFCLETLFPHVHIYARHQQPLLANFSSSEGTQTVALSHGDKYATGFAYNLYSWLLRKPLTLRLLEPFEKSIISKRMQKLSAKNICHDFKGFEQRVNKILAHYQNQKVDLVIEGHFHQAKTFGKYISLPSLACQQQIARAEEGHIVFMKIDDLF